LSTEIKNARIRTGLTQEEAAKKIGVHPTTLNKYESGARHPSGKVLAKMAHHYKVLLESLLFLNNDALINKPDEMEAREEMQYRQKMEAELLELYRENRRLKDKLEAQSGKKLGRTAKIINGD